MAKTSRPRSAKVVKMPITESAARSALSTRAVSDDDIARRAFELYCARGCQDGRDLEDWLQAECELRGTKRSRLRKPLYSLG